MYNFRTLLLACLLFGLLPTLIAQTTAKADLIRTHQAIFSQPNLGENGGYEFFRFPLGQALDLPGNTLAEKANYFWTNYGSIFSIYELADIALVKHKTDRYGGQHLLFQQRVEGDQVLGAELYLHFNRDHQLSSGGGFFVLTQVQARDLTTASNPNLPTRPVNISFDFRESVRIQMAKEYPTIDWSITAGDNYLLSEELLGPQVGGLHWVKEINAKNVNGPQEYQLYLDLATGRLVEKIQVHCDALDRVLYNGSTFSTPIWEEGDAYPGSLNAARQSLVRTSGETYHLFHKTFGRDSYDNNGGTMNIVDNATSIGCPNASAGSNTIYFCPGTTTDDIIGHEWAHAYTRSINGLIYQWESGAINEGFSDIFGEVIDLLNTSGNDSNDAIPRTSCNQASNQRWKMGEDATAFGGHIRDMFQPACQGDPASKTSNNYWCNTGDNGGVHINSGVLNRSFSLLVDGGNLNGVTVTGIGLTKATHIYHQAWANYLSRVTDYDAMADALELAGQDLLGQNLLELVITDTTPGSSGEIISNTDLVALADAILATRMRTDGPCFDDPALDQNTPELCTEVSEEFTVIFSQDFEGDVSSWTTNQFANNPATWDSKPWRISENLPDERTGKGAFGPNPYVGDCSSDLDNGYVDLTSPTISLPASGSDFLLRFDHYFSIESNWDGGHLFMSINGASPVHVNGSHFIFNGYVTNLNGGFNDNPMAGLGAFTGSDNASTSGSWGQSHVDLTSAGVQAGDDIQLVWRMSHDGCNGWLGWYLDDIEVGYC
ncbi:MAG: M4 family metallopeptidase, partial [Bacteroidota bacterium]